MSTRNRIPTPLQPYLRLPPETSLTLLTGTLGCSPTWLAARFVGSILNPQDRAETGHEGDKTAVLIASWTKNEAFWTTELRRAAGLDTGKLAAGGRFAFMDCFSGLMSGIPERVLAQAEAEIKKAIGGLQGRNIALLLDSPDVLLGLGLANADQLNTMLMTLRASVHSTALMCSADLPFIEAASASPVRAFAPIEVEGAAFVVQQAHVARFVLSVRELDTGAARDVSGALKVTRGGAAYGWDDESEPSRETEALYLVSRDGSAKVFKRGAVST